MKYVLWFSCGKGVLDFVKQLDAIEIHLERLVIIRERMNCASL
jgi:hypothetical protein